MIYQRIHDLLLSEGIKQLERRRAAFYEVSNLPKDDPKRVKARADLETSSQKWLRGQKKRGLFK
jgi:hypothetical protein